MGDIKTYVDEMCIKFVHRSEPVSGFDAYVQRSRKWASTARSSLYQGAYERYINR
jgi:hypothetical protein